MTLNELITRYNFISLLTFSHDKTELNENLKIKIISLRLKLSKVKTQFENDVQEVIKSLTTDKLNELAKKERSEEEEKEYQELIEKLNKELNIFLKEKEQEEVKDIDCYFTQEEFDDIVKVNVNLSDIVINNNKITTPDFLEMFYKLFVK